jgi:hypothetical protein
VYRKHRYIPLSSPNNVEGMKVTNLRRRLNNVIAELKIIREGLSASHRYPTCCLAVNNNGEISCELKGPMPERKFLEECKKCRAEIRKFLERIG